MSASLLFRTPNSAFRVCSSRWCPTQISEIENFEEELGIGKN